MKIIKFFLVFICFIAMYAEQTPTPFADNNSNNDKQQEVKKETYIAEKESIEEGEDNSLEFLDAIQNSFFVSSRKDTDNNLNIVYKRGQTYKIRLRYAMVTSFIFENDVVEKYINGDPVGFSIEEVRDFDENIKSLIIKPLKIGIDSNLIVFGKSGQVYTFYLFATHFTNRRQPLFSVYIKNSEKVKGGINANTTNTKNDFKNSKAKAKIQNQEEEKMRIDYSAYEKDEGKFLVIGDEVNRLYIEKAKIQRDFYQKPKAKRTWWSLWLYKKPSNGSKKIQAKEIFRDKDYTYFKYNRADNQNKFPTVFRVVDGYDNPVNTKIVGDYIVAEDVSDKFTLKLGEEYVCVERIK